MDIASDDAAQWLRAHSKQIAHGIQHFDENLVAAERHELLYHLGSTFQTHNPLKSRSDAVCQVGPKCRYCAAASN